ncbi:U4/U6 small nuclear ribonucleoprotein Prp3 [Elysia marginata]|uniref:U4/U6 small nuclear ribonucleoprotein Prp3 n=1 Tax=Elysia marginata TaxID=1093978 RepID=A0AAV4F8X1_9GAST|nr:U4/U6 small nuclear ribonucleoprotein Prp3 [Elysia marginata]
MSRLRETDILLTEIKNRPLLYNTSNPFYKDNARRAEAWREIAKLVFPEAAGKVAEVRRVKELQARWKSLRDSYSKHRKRVLTYGEEGLHCKPYIFAAKLSFLDKFMTFRDPPGGKDNGMNSNVNEEEEEDNDDKSSTTLDFECEEEAMIGHSSVKPEPEPSTDFNDAPESSSNSRFRPVMTPAREQQKREFWALEQMMRRIVELENREERDPDMAFFASLLPSLRGFNEDQKLEFRTEVLLLMRAIKAGTNKTETRASSSFTTPN